MILSVGVKEYFERVYERWQVEIAELEQRIDSPAFMSVNALMGSMMVWDSSGEIIPHEQYIRAMRALENSAEASESGIRDIKMKIIEKLVERAYDYFARRKNE